MDIQVPAVDRIYDFELDETLAIALLTEKIAGIIREKEQLLDRTEESLQLFSLKRGAFLQRAFSLKEYGIESGERLVLL